jgi:phosphatidylinositol glycan class S
VFNDEGAFLSSLLQNSPFESPSHQLQSAEQQAKLDARNTRTFKYASTYHLTFSLFTPHGSPSAWDIEEALSESIARLIEPLSAISHFAVNTQVQLFAQFSPSISGPAFDSVNNRWSLQHDDLSGFVNAAEWPLSPSIGSGPTINFILYVPAPEQTPLSVGDSGQTSWIIPQWGGVQIHNMANNASRLTAADLEEDMLIFAEQLTTLLGVPQTPPSLSLRISSLARERTTSLVLSASSTLGALARLTLKLTSIAIPDSVAKSVDATIHHLDQACQNLNAGRYQAALENARIAEAEVEKAFFEPSMVGQVYFPEEHKVAVYVPLLGPMAVPLLMAGLKELRKLRERKVKTN